MTVSVYSRRCCQHPPLMYYAFCFVELLSSQRRRRAEPTIRGQTASHLHGAEQRWEANGNETSYQYFPAGRGGEGGGCESKPKFKMHLGRVGFIIPDARRPYKSVTAGAGLLSPIVWTHVRTARGWQLSFSTMCHGRPRLGWFGWVGCW